MKKSKVFSKIDLKAYLPDLTSALVVSFLSIAAGSAFGVLTGLGVKAGILGMIIAPLVGWFFKGIPVKVSGPTGPIASAVLIGIIGLEANNIDKSAIFILAAMAGIILFIVGFTRINSLVKLISNVVTAVFINGVALIIIKSQATKIIGYQSLTESTRFWETGMALGALGFLYLWPYISKGFANSIIGRLLSGSLMAMLLGGAVNYIFNQPLQGVMVAGELLPSQIAINFEQFKTIPLSTLIGTTLKLSLVIFFVTVVSIRAITKDKDKYEAEIKNIGISNIMVSLLGGVASTMGFIRTKILINNGAKTPLSGIFTSILVLALLLLAQPLLEVIPVSIFVGILIKVAIGSIDWQFLKDFRQAPKKNMIPFLFISIGSLSMLWFDQVVVLVCSIILWYIIQKIPALSPQCKDLDQCPIAMMEMNHTQM